MMYTSIMIHNHRVKVLSMFGGHKTVIDTVL